MTHKGARAGRRKHGGGHAEEHENHERWLVTYADMVTLLMVLFIVMFAMSQVDSKKFAELADGLADGFGAPSVAFSGKTGPLEGSANDTAVIPIDPGVNPGLGGEATKPDSAESQAAVRASDRSRAAAKVEAARREVANLREVQEQIAKALAKQKLSNTVRFTIDQRGLVVTIVTSSVVFAGDRADLLPAGQRIVAAIAPPLKILPNDIEVDGHTNQLPVPTVNYPTAWELSTARASTVVRYLVRHGLAAGRFTAAGFAGNRPLFPADDPRAVTMNRRVEIVVLSTLPADERALLPTVAGTH